MNVFLGEYELVHSNVIISINENPITIVLPDEIEGDYKFILNFLSKSEEKDSITNYTMLDKFTMQIDFINFDGFNGGGNTELTHLGTLKNYPLFLNYRVFDLPDVGKTIAVNFYIRKEATNGK